MLFRSGSLFFGLFTLCFNIGLQTVPAGRAGTIVAAMPALTLILAVCARVEPFNLTKVSGVLVALVGVGIVLSDGRVETITSGNLASGDLWLLGAALCGAVYNVGAGPYLARAGAITVAFWSMLGGVVLLSMISAARVDWPDPSSMTAGALAAVVFLGTASGAIGFTLWIWALGRAAPTQVAVFFTLNPVSAAALGALTLGEAVGPVLLVGMVIVLSGIILTANGSTRRPKTR